MKNELSRSQIIDLLNYLGSPKILDKGRDNIQFCCTVHHEEHPSAGISIEKQLFHCFACGASGSLSWLVLKSLPDEFKSIKQVDEFIKYRYNVDVNSYAYKIRKGLKRFEEYFTDKTDDRFELPLYKLASFKSGKETYEYFLGRGFTKETVAKFMIGRDLVNETVTVPVYWEDGALAGIIGRYIDPNRPKNSRYRVYEFPKGSLLFPLDKLEVVEDTIILVEGVFDAIWMHQNGFTNTLAIMGNHLSKQQAEMIKSRCKRVIGFFDNDEGGQIAHDSVKRMLGKDIIYYWIDYDVTIKDFFLGKLNYKDKKDPCEMSKYDIGLLLKNKQSEFNREIKRL